MCLAHATPENSFKAKDTGCTMEKGVKNTEKGVKKVQKFFQDIQDSLFKSCKECGKCTIRFRKELLFQGALMGAFLWMMLGTPAPAVSATEVEDLYSVWIPHWTVGIAATTILSLAVFCGLTGCSWFRASALQSVREIFRNPSPASSVSGMSRKEVVTKALLFAAANSFALAVVCILHPLLTIMISQSPAVEFVAGHLRVITTRFNNEALHKETFSGITKYFSPPLTRPPPSPWDDFYRVGPSGERLPAEGFVNAGWRDYVPRPLKAYLQAYELIPTVAAIVGGFWRVVSLCFSFLRVKTGPVLEAVTVGSPEAMVLSALLTAGLLSAVVFACVRWIFADMALAAHVHIKQNCCSLTVAAGAFGFLYSDSLLPVLIIFQKKYLSNWAYSPLSALIDNLLPISHKVTTAMAYISPITMLLVTTASLVSVPR
ncbi:putative transmembrane protein [Gregarina niphandrodes]|uniref:Transmembrane protein n=1 Tax=Gregarina niphandrodes TaxID=110365 RepID=A0A023B9L3_GRENI|nr:putative transmembrane protein [Gregarina niphandrodes]EZG72949.1 putative transmembrane protein [Gregarina niphandrodes]|eukprot:XP_011129709.1 putative transmembrane protein [Gregarina niphandrodes]